MPERLRLHDEFQLSNEVTKYCRRCRTHKPPTEFARDNRRGHQHPCKACARQIAQERGYDLNRHIAVRSNLPLYLKHSLSLLRARARKKGLTFDLDLHETELLARLEPMRCEMSGIPLVITVGRIVDAGHAHFQTPSFDRINSNKGYTYDNVRIICYALNCALGTWSETALRTVIKAWLAQDTSVSGET